MLGNAPMRPVTKPEIVLSVIAMMNIEFSPFGEEAFVAVCGLDEADDTFSFFYFLFG